MLDILNPYKWLLAIGLVAALVLGFVTWKAVLIRNADKAGYERAVNEGAAAVRAQQERNRALQRAAELKYTIRAETLERVIVQTITEVRHAAAPLAACPVPAAAIRLLNAAAKCASEGGPTSCGTGDEVQPAERPSK